MRTAVVISVKMRPVASVLFASVVATMMCSSVSADVVTPSLYLLN